MASEMDKIPKKFYIKNRFPKKVFTKKKPNTFSSVVYIFNFVCCDELLVSSSVKCPMPTQRFGTNGASAEVQQESAFLKERC